MYFALYLVKFHIQIFITIEATIAYILTKVWRKMIEMSNPHILQATATAATTKGEPTDDDGESELFLRWFTMTAYSACLVKYKTIRTKRYRSIWLTESTLEVMAKQKRSETRKRKVR